MIEFAYKIVQMIERFVVRYSLVGDKTFFNAADFPWTSLLEENWKTIRTELDGILEYGDVLPNFQDISKDQKALTTDDEWKTYFLYGFGFRAEKNCERCPETARLVA